MRIFRALEDVPTDFGPSLVSLGNFDGVHRAHQQVLKEMIARARETGGKSIAVTFNPHPVQVLRPEGAPRLITPQAQKEAFLAQTGLDALLVIPFTREFSMISSEDFARNVLAKRLHAKAVYEGENFRFGHGGKGDISSLAEFGHELGFEVKVYPMMTLRGEPISSSRVRELIAAGRVGRANRLLGRAFSVVSTPSLGRGYGHKYTVPTINLSRYEGLIPSNGVYITRTRAGNQLFNSVTNVGTRPTFGDGLFAIETHLFDFHPLELTPETKVEVSFLSWRRAEIRFPSVEALKEQIGKDIKWALRYFQLSGKQCSSPSALRTQ